MRYLSSITLAAVALAMAFVPVQAAHEKVPCAVQWYIDAEHVSREGTKHLTQCVANTKLGTDERSHFVGTAGCESGYYPYAVSDSKKWVGVLQLGRKEFWDGIKRVKKWWPKVFRSIHNGHMHRKNGRANVYAGAALWRSVRDPGTIWTCA